MKLRGDAVAVLLADYRMPEMDGIEFLEQAMDLLPVRPPGAAHRLRRHRCRDHAINVVDLDHYLLKPWDPPEEKLYPVIDGCSRSGQRRATARSPRPRCRPPMVGPVPRGAGVPGPQPGARTGGTVRRAGGRAAAGRRGRRPTTLPVVITADGEVLVEPTDSELAEKVGLSTAPAEDFYDIVVIGAGPAGLGAAVYGASEGLRTVLVERTATGGQAGQSSRIENYLGFPDGVSGAQLTERARRQALKFGAEMITTRDVVGVEVNGSARTVRFADGGTVDAHTVILATGVSYRQLSAPGAGRAGRARRVLRLRPVRGPGCAGQDVYIVGGANSAGQAAVYFSRYARTVNMLVRGPSLELSMSYYLIQQLAGIGNINIRTNTEIVCGHGDEHLEGLTLRNNVSGDEDKVQTGLLFCFIGAAPRTEWLDGSAVRDNRGFVVAGPDLVVDGKRPAGWPLDRDPYHLETSIPGVFVAGDVRADSVKRVASAVGEGAMAVTLVHRYLEKR